jgi:hypothetical protein
MGIMGPAAVKKAERFAQAKNAPAPASLTFLAGGGLR